MRRPLLFVVVAVVAAAVVTAAVLLSPGAQESRPSVRADYSGWVAAQGLNRTYVVHVPTGYDGRRSLPLLLAFHSLGEDAKMFQNSTGLNDLADGRGFIVVYPNQFGADDESVLLVSALLDKLAGELSLDQSRIYATGFSIGGFLSMRLACELSDRIAAAAAVAATMEVTWGGRCQPPRPVAVLLLHGTADFIVPSEGSTTFMSVAATLEKWAAINACTTPATVTNELPKVRHEVYAPCQGGSGVELYETEGLGHGWPSSQRSPISASEVVWTFLQQYRRG